MRLRRHTNPLVRLLLLCRSKRETARDRARAVILFLDLGVEGLVVNPLFDKSRLIMNSAHDFDSIPGAEFGVLHLARLNLF